MSAEALRRAAEQARMEAETQRAVAPHLAKLYGDDCGSELAARRHLAIANLLDGIAGDFGDEQDYSGGDYVSAALTVARAYSDATP